MAYPLLLIVSLMLSMNPETRIVKLPRPCVPEHYELKIDFSDLDDAIPEMKGNIEIRINCVADTNNLTVNWKQLFIAEDSVSIRSCDEKKSQSSRNLIKHSKIIYQTDRDFLVITFDQNLKQGSKYVLAIGFSKILEQGSTALYKTSYNNSTDESTISTVLSNLYPMNARMVFPCFDEPDLKASFNLSLVYSPYYNAISNLKSVEDRCIEHSSETNNCRKFTSKSPIAPFQLAFSINDYDEMHEADFNKPIIEGLTNDCFEEVETAVNYSAKFLERFRELLGVEYPSEKLTLITIAEIPWEFSGGIGLLGVPNDIKDEKLMSQHLARGLLRQILSDRLTFNNWTDLWLVEGLTWYFTQEVFVGKYPEASERCWEVSRLDSTLALQTYFSITDLSQLDDIGLSAFCIFSDLISYIGKPYFSRGVKKLFEYSKKKAIDVEALSDSFSDAHLKKSNLIEVFEKWPSTVEVPILNVSRSAYPTTQYQMSIGLSNQSSNCRPLRVFFNNISLLVNCSKPFVVNSTTIPLNFNKLNKYKVLFDVPTYELIATQLVNPNNLSTYNRIQLIQDALHFAWMGTVNYSVALKLVNYLRNETELQPWQAALYHFDRMWYLLGEDSRKSECEKFLGRLVSPMYQKLKALKASDKISDESQNLYTLLSIWACRLHLDNCSKIIRNFVNDGGSTLSYFMEALLKKFIYYTNKDLNGINKTNTSIQTENAIIKAFELVGTLIMNPKFQETMGKAPLPNDAVLTSTSMDTLIWLYMTNDQTNRIIVRSMAERIVSEDDYELIRRVANDLSNEAVKGEVLSIIRSNLDWVKMRKEEFFVSILKLKP